MPNDRDTVGINSPHRDPGEDGTVSVHFGGCDDNRFNRLPVMDGGDYIVRLYLPPAESMTAQRDHLAEGLSLPALVRLVNLCERQLTRVGKRTGRCHRGRLGRSRPARVRLPAPGDHQPKPSSRSRTCGFGAPETMNRAFRRRGLTPRAEIIVTFARRRACAKMQPTQFSLGNESKPVFEPSVRLVRAVTDATP